MRKNQYLLPFFRLGQTLTLMGKVIVAFGFISFIIVIFGKYFYNLFNEIGRDGQSINKPIELYLTYLPELWVMVGVIVLGSIVMQTLLSLFARQSKKINKGLGRLINEEKLSKDAELISRACLGGKKSQINKI